MEKSSDLGRTVEYLCSLDNNNNIITTNNSKYDNLILLFQNHVVMVLSPQAVVHGIIHIITIIITFNSTYN